MQKRSIATALAGAAIAFTLAAATAMAAGYGAYPPPAQGYPQGYPQGTQAYPGYGPPPGYPNAPASAGRAAPRGTAAVDYPFSMLRLDARQHARVLAIQQGVRSRMEKLLERGASVGRKLNTLFLSGAPVDPKAARHEFDAMSRIQYDLLMLRVDSWNRALAVLTKEQQAQLRALLRERRPPARR